MTGGRIAALAALASSALMICAPSAGAVTPVTCANLQAAMNGAAAGEVLQLPPGVCKANVGVANTASFTLEGATSGGATVLEPINSGLPIIGSGSTDVTFTLKGLTFTGMNGAAAVSTHGPGEAITVTGNTFTGNSYPDGFGAALSFQILKAATATRPTVITGNTFTNNAADGGGAIVFLQSAVPVTISNNRFFSNSSRLGGGAVYIDNADPGGGAVQLTHNTFGGPGSAGNTTTGQGGALFVQLQKTQSLTLGSNTFQGNKVTGAHQATAAALRLGGALYVATAFAGQQYPVTQSDNAFLGNLVDETQQTPTPALPAGGGAEWITGLTVHSTADRFIGNRVSSNDGLPPEGGALGAFASSPQTPAPAFAGVFVGADDLFGANSVAAGGRGGAIYVGGGPVLCAGTCPPSSVSLTNSTVVRNHLDPGADSDGGAIWGSPTDRLTLNNSIVYGNTPKPELYGFSSAKPTVGYSDVCSEKGGPAVAGKAGYNLCADPKLTTSGAETLSSPTIDAGFNILIPKGLTTDLAGNRRIQPKSNRCDGTKPPSIVDMGAFEFPTARLPCPHPPPFGVQINSRRLHARHGRVTVSLTCLGAKPSCVGTVKILTRGHHVRTLGRHSLRIRSGHTARIRVTLTARGSGKVTILVSAHDRAGHHKRTRRGATLAR